MVYSDGESYSDAEIFSEPEDLFNDEAEETGDDKKDVRKEEEDEKKPPEETKVKKKSQRIVKNPRKTLNFESLRGSNGLSALRKLFKDFRFRGEGHEEEDLTRVMGLLQQWMSYQLCPSYSFESCMLQLEALGKKKVVQTLMKKYRSGIVDWGEGEEDAGDAREEGGERGERGEGRDEFDVLLDEQIANARSDGEFSEEEGGGSGVQGQSLPENEEVTLTPEQMERIARNRKLAEERRLKRMSEQCSQLRGQTGLPEKVTTEDNSEI